MTSSQEPSAADTEPTASAAALPMPVDPAPPLLNQYLPGQPEEAEGGPPAPPVKAEDGETLRLVKPDNIRSRFWVYFHKYDLEYHPDKKNTARCNICGKDISVKQGTGGLKNHLKFKHPEEYAALFVGDDPIGAAGANTLQIRAAIDRIETQIKTEQGTQVKTEQGGGPPKKKPRGGENAYLDIMMSRDAEKRNNEKHWMEMWSLARREIRTLRQELRDEKDEGARRDLEGDLRVMEKKKADYAQLLGYEDIVVSPTAEEV